VGATIRGGEGVARSGSDFIATPAGLLVRAGAAAVLALLVFLVPVFTNSTWDGRIGVAAIFAIVGLSINILTGYAGQVSLGHQGLVGIGAFVSAFIAKPSLHASFFVALPIAGLSGAVVAIALGVIALRRRGLHLAVVTLAFGLVAQHTIFGIREFSGGASGVSAPRPGGFHSNQAYAYLCLLFLGLFLLVDWRVVKTKAGRAFMAIRTDERVAAAFGINATGYKLLAFAVSGFLAGVAGSLLAHESQVVFPNFFDLGICFIWVSMTLIGGLGSRSGIVIASAFFALFPFLLILTTQSMGLHFDEARLTSYTPLLAALLALLTLIRFPGGLGAGLMPVRRWLAGGPLRGGRATPERPGPGADGRGELPLELGLPPSVAEPAPLHAAPSRSSSVHAPPMPAPGGRRGLRAFRRWTGR
jgi:branched-chain amino acid transport system permease protein